MVCLVPPEGPGSLQLPSYVRTRRQQLKQKSTWLTAASWLDRLDVLYTPGHTLPRRARGHRVVTIHDVIFEQYPDTYPVETAKRLHIGTEKACLRAKRVVTESEATKHELVTRFGVLPDRVDVISARYDETIVTSPAGPLPAKLLAANVAPGFFLCFGRLNRRKNLRRVVDARSLLAQGAQCGALVSPDRNTSERTNCMRRWHYLLSEESGLL